MDLTSFLSIEGWVKLERTIRDRYNLESSVFDLQGIRITNNKVWVNNLCPAIKSTNRGQRFICAVAHMNLANQANREKKPILANNKLIGSVGACGLLPENGKIDSFLIEKITSINEKEILILSKNISTISEKKQKESAQYI